jgi:hypothetical protein
VDNAKNQTIQNDDDPHAYRAMVDSVDKPHNGSSLTRPGKSRTHSTQSQGSHHGGSYQGTQRTISTTSNDGRDSLMVFPNSSSSSSRNFHKTHQRSTSHSQSHVPQQHLVVPSESSFNGERENSDNNNTTSQIFLGQDGILYSGGDSRASGTGGEETDAVLYDDDHEDDGYQSH